MKKVALYIITTFSFFCYLICDGQSFPDSTKTVRIETDDGNIFIGFIVKEDTSSVVIQTDYLGEITIPCNFIKTKTKLNKVKKIGRDVWLPNPQAARYFWAPNGYGLEKRNSYYQNIWILYNQVSYGLSDNFSIGAGTLPLFLFGGQASPFWIVPKFSIPLIRDKLNLGTGVFLGTVIGEQFSAYGLCYATTTIGSRDKNFSLGLAYGFTDEEWMKTPLVNFSYLCRIGPRGYFISENYFFSSDDFKIALVSLGGRSIIKNLSLDYSLWIPLSTEMESFVAIPFLGITVPIGHKK